MFDLFADKNIDKYQGIFDLLAERLRNLSQANQDNDQSIRRSFVPATTVGNTVNESSIARNTSNLNNVTVLSRNATQKNQINDQNSRRSYVPMAADYTGSLLAGNTPAGNQLAGNSPAGNQMAGNLPRSQMADNSPLATQLAGNFPAANPPAPTQLVGNFPAANPPVENQLLGNPSTGDLAARNQPVTNLSAGNSSPLGTNTTKPASKFSTNTEQIGASMFPTSSNDGPISHEDRSGLYTNLYRQPASSYDRKNTIYHQNSQTPSHYSRGNANTYGNISPPSSYIRKSGVITPDQYTRSYQNYPQQIGHSAPNYQQYYSYPGNPSYQQQEWRRGYQGSPGYQVNYPGTSQQNFYPATKEPHNSVPEHLDKKWSVPGNSKDNENNINSKHDYAPSQKPSTIQRKLPENAVRKSTYPTTQSLPVDNAQNSGSGSGFDESDDLDMDNTADIQESRELSGSGSGNDDEDLDGDTSNVAFMLAGTHRNKPPSFPVPGLPMNLTRQQAIDIYKSALYFAGLLREGEW